MTWCNIRFCICHCVDSVQPSMEVKTVSAQFYRGAQHQVWSSNGHLIRAAISVLSPLSPSPLSTTLQTIHRCHTHATSTPHSIMCSWYFSMALCLHKNVSQSVKVSLSQNICWIPKSFLLKYEHWFDKRLVKRYKRILLRNNFTIIYLQFFLKDSRFNFEWNQLVKPSTFLHFVGLEKLL